MYKLQGHSLTRGPWFLPESQSLTLSEKSSTSTITMPMDSAVQVEFNDWLYDEDVPGADPIVWRVKSISESSQTGTVTVELEHVIRLLEDQQIFGEITTENISGGTSCTARQAIEFLLDGNFDWRLGALEVDNSCPYEFETLSVYDAIESVTDTLEGVYWEYDLTQHPFVLNVRALNRNPSCEMREGRNLSTLKRSVSRTGMYTRIYPIGENDLHIPGDYISNNEEIYGRIDKVVTDSTKTTIENLGAWAHGLLMHNSDPDVTITVSGLELSEATNEPMDRLRLNRFCRCPLPEYATTIIERITKLVWKDLIKDRESVTVTLANNMKDLSEIIKSESKKAGGGSGAAGQAKQNYLFQANGEHLLYEVFDENGHLHGVLRMTSESLRVAFENLNECTRSEFRMTSESLRISFENEIRSTRSEFQMTSESLRIQFENDIASTRSEFEMTSASMRVEFTNDIASARSEFQMTAQSLRVSFENGIASTRSLVEQTDRAWRASVEGVADSDGKITAASIGVAINAAGDSEAWIDASHIWIGNEKATTVIAGKLNASDVTAEYLAAKIANIPTLRGIAASFSGNVSTTSGVIAYQVYADGNNISNPVMETRVSAPVNNVYTLQHKTADGTWHDAGTFSRATSLSGAWSGTSSSGKAYKVTASPQGTTKTSPSVNTLSKSGDPSWASNEKSFTQNILVQDSDGESIYLGSLSFSGFTKGNFSPVQVSPIDSGKWIRVDSTAVTLYNAGTSTFHDRGDSITGRQVLSEGGTFYYPAGEAATYYKAGTNTVYARGSTVTRYLRSSSGISLTHDGAARHYDVNGNLIGNFDWYHVSSSGTTYYTAGGTAVDYQGDGGAYTVQGEEVSVTPINSNAGIRLGAASTYYKGNGGAKTAQGTAQDAYKKLSSGGTLYYQNAGSQQYYTKS